MEKFLRKSFISLFILATTIGAFAQVNVTATAGTSSAFYTTLKDAFDAINAGTHQGDIIIEITGNTLEGSNSCVLNSGDAVPANYTSVLIRPAVDGVSIVASPPGGRGVIELNGADNVTIDGDNPYTIGINRDLTIVNIAAPTTTYSSVIRLATSSAVTSTNNITVRNCILEGNAIGRNLSSATNTSGSENTTFGILAGPNAGSTPTASPSSITSVTGTAPAGTTLNNITFENNRINQVARGIAFMTASASVCNSLTITKNEIGDNSTLTGIPPYTSPSTTVYTKGIYLAGVNSVSITQNTITNIMSYVPTAIVAIELNSSIGSGPIEISDNVINGVVLNSTTASNTARGISVLSAGGPYSIIGNSITNVQNFNGSSTNTNQPIGIFVNTSAPFASISNNKIQTVINRNPGTYGVTAVSLSGGNNITFQNNFISDVNEDISGGGAFNAVFGYGVYGLRITSGTGHKIYNNSINLSGSLIGTASSSIMTAALSITSTTVTGADVRNNILSNTLTGGTTSIAHVSLYLPSGATSSMNLTLNNNAYYCGTDAARQGILQVGTTPGTGFYLPQNFNSASTTPATNSRAYTSTLNTAGTNDNASFALTDPAPFVSNTDLHIPNATTTILESSGADNGVSTDIDGDTRPGPAGSVNGGPFARDIGADEFDGINPNFCSGTPSSPTVTSSVPTSCGTTNTVLTSTGHSSGMGITYQWKSSNVSGGPYVDIAGATSPTYTVTGVSSTTYYILETTCTLSGISTISNETSTVILPELSGGITPSSATICAGESQTLTVTPNTGDETYSWYHDGSTTASISVSPTSNTNYTVNVTSPSGCGTFVSTITVNPVSAASASVSPSNVCGGLPVVFTGSSTGTGVMATLLDASFNSGFDGFIAYNGSTGGNPANAAWTLRPSGYVYSSTTFISNDNSQFLLTNSDAQGNGSTTLTELYAPVLNASGYLTLNLTFYHYYRHLAGSSASVDVSTDSVNWINVKTYSSTVGAPNSFAPENINLNAYAGAPKLYVRFKFSASWDYYWALDNVKITGELAPLFIWKGPLGDTVATTRNFTIPSAGVGDNGDYILVVTNPFNCTSQDTVSLTVIPNVPASVTPSSQIICNGESVTISANPRGSGETYLWSNGETTPDITVSPSSNTSYTVSVTSANSCVTSAVSNITVSSVPTASASVSSNDFCAGLPVTIYGGQTDSVVLVSANFDNTVLDGGFVAANASTGGIVANAAWTSHPSGYVYSGNSFVTPDASGFWMSNSDAQGSSGTLTSTTLTSASFSTSGLTEVKLKLNHYYNDYNANDFAFVEVSTNGGSTWTTIKTYSTDQGSSTSFATDLIDLSAYIGLSDVRIRFRYQAVYGYYWAINDVKVYGKASLTYSWAGPSSATYTGINIHIPVTTSADSGTYTLTVTNTYGCSAQASVNLNIKPSPVVNFPALGSYCDTIGTVSLNTATPPGGVYSGTGVVESLGSYSFDVSVGNSLIKYVYTNNYGCSDSSTQAIVVNPSTTYYRDADGDGKGDPNVSLQACYVPSGYVTNNQDCDDNNNGIFSPITYYLDADGDGYGDPANSTTLCVLTPPSGYVTNSDDCNDNNININPLTVWFEDQDGDGFGNPASFVSSCTQPTGYVADSTDCDDTDSNIYPTLTWYQDADGDGFGNPIVSQLNCYQPAGYVANNTDCNDNDASLNPNTTWYADADGDTYGDASVTVQSCTQPAGYVLNNADCNDNDASLNPNTTWYADADGDGYGDANNTLSACAQPVGFVANSTDCNDNDALSYVSVVAYIDSDNDGYNAGQTNVCYDGVNLPSGYSLTTLGTDCNDNDVNSTIGTTFYADMDGDGFGDANNSITTCTQPTGYVADNTDCNDNDASLNPNTTWYADADGDGYGDANNTLSACTQPVGFVANNTDCNDNDALSYVSVVAYIDSDNDGYNAGQTNVCYDGVNLPSGYSLTTLGTDCNDNDVNSTIGTTFYADMDEDGFGDANNSVTACTQPTGYVADSTDCNDADSTIFPTVLNPTFTVDASAEPDYVFVANETSATQYLWSIDGVAVGSAPALNYTFTQNGQYVVELTVTDACGNEYTSNQQINVTATGVSSTANTKLKVYPSPANQFVYMGGLSGNVAIEVTTVNGQVVKQTANDFSKISVLQIDTSELVNGVYFVKATTSQGVHVVKFNVAR